MACRQLARNRSEMKFAQVAVAVDQQISGGLEPLENVDRLEQGRVLHDQGIGLENRFAQPDFLVVDAAERHDRRPGALGAETRKGLRVTLFDEGRDRQQLRGGHHALATAAVETNLKHRAGPGGCTRASRDRTALLTPALSKPTAEAALS